MHSSDTQRQSHAWIACLACSGQITAHQGQDITAIPPLPRVCAASVGVAGGPDQPGVTGPTVPPRWPHGGCALPPNPAREFGAPRRPSSPRRKSQVSCVMARAQACKSAPPPPHSPIGRVSLAQRGTPYICLSELQPPFWAVRRQERDPPLGGGVPHSKRHNRPHRAWRLCGRRHPDRQMALRALWCARRWGGGV